MRLPQLLKIEGDILRRSPTDVHPYSFGGGGYLRRDDMFLITGKYDTLVRRD